MRYQPRIKGSRRTMPTAVIQQIEHVITEIATQYDVSRSWVIATAISDYFGITIPHYYDLKPRQLRRAK